MSEDHRVTELLLRWEELYEQGQDVPAAELCRDCPELERELAGRIRDLKEFSWVKKPFGQSDSLGSRLPPAGNAGPLPTETASSAPLAGRYRLDRVIGKGGFGLVWRGFDTQLRRPVAVKVPRPGRLSGGQVEGFLAEARKAAQLKHPGIVPVHDVGQHAGSYFIVSALVEGTDLEGRLRKGPLPVREGVRTVAEVARSLHYAHQQGFVHRDVKPANILTDRQGQVYVTDFGLAATETELRLREADCGGTLAYMAPEQMRGDTSRIDARSDVYGLGVTLYELLTGRLPFSAVSVAELRDQVLHGGPPPSPRSINPKVPRQVERICLKCLAKDPADRYATAQELADDLTLTIARRPTRRRALVALSLVFALTALALVAAFSHSRNSRSPLARRIILWQKLPDGTVVMVPESKWEKEPLFNGTDTGGWILRGRPGAFWASGEGIVCDGADGSILRTERPYPDMLLRLQYRWTDQGDGQPRRFAVLPRMPEDAGEAGDCIRVEVREGEDAELTVPPTYQTKNFHFEKFNNLEQVENPPGQWNELQIIYKDDRIDVDINRRRYRWAGGVSTAKTGAVGILTEGAGLELRRADVLVILDFSGSMNNESDLWNSESYLDNGSNQSKAAPNGEFDSNVGSDYGFMLEHNQFSNWTSNNVENVYPQFGPYIGSTSAARTNTNVGNDYVHYDNCPNLLCPAADGSSPLFGNTEIGKSNMVTDLNASNSSIPSAFQNMGIPAVVKDFYSNNRGAFAFSLCHAAGPATAGQAPRLPSLWPGPANRRVPLRRQLSSAHELLKEAFALP